MFTIKQKNPEYFGPEVRGKIIFQKFQSKTKDLCFEVFLLSLGLEKTNGIALTICLFLGSSLAVYIFAPFMISNAKDSSCGVGWADTHSGF